MRNDTTRETRNTSLQIYIFPLSSPKFSRTIAELFRYPATCKIKWSKFIPNKSGNNS